MITLRNVYFLAHRLLLICAPSFRYRSAPRRMPWGGDDNNNNVREICMRIAKTSFALCASVLAGVLVAPIPGQAASLGLTAFGSFQNIVAGPDSRYLVQNNDPVTDALLSWGDSRCETCDAYTSRLGFEGAGSERKGELAFATVETGSPFRIGTLLFSTGTLGGDEASVSAAELLLSLQLSAGEAADFVFSLGVGNTPDDSDAKHGVPDTLNLDYRLDAYRFSAAGQSYSLRFLGLSLDGGLTFTDFLMPAEGDKVKAGLYAEITPELQPIPLPAAVWLFGSGLLALAGLLRR